MTDRKSDAKKRGRGATRKRQYKSAEQRRKEILEAADTLFMTKGFLATGIKDIVRAVGISYGNFYYHFPTKRDILFAFANARLERMEATIREWEGDETMTPRAQIMKMLEAVESFRNFRISIDFIKGGEAREDPELNNTFINMALPRSVKSIGRVFERGVEAGDFRMSDPRGGALLFFIMTADMLHRASNVEKVAPWKQLRHTYRTMVARVVGVEDDAFVAE